jgi:hypothetical protein
MPGEASTIFVDVSEGPAFARIPADIHSALAASASNDDHLQAGLETAALVIVRVGAEAGELLLRHLITHDADLVLGADPLFAKTLAREPELITGPLAGTPACEIR